MIEEILPAATRSAELFQDPDEPIVLFPEEEEAVSRAVAKRRTEFSSARLCARRALAAMGHAPVPLVPGERGAPGWPAGIVGSMTHCAGYRAAVVANDTEITTIGVDAEPSDGLPDGVFDAIARPEEHDPVKRLIANAPDVHWDRLLFSAKESVYKAWFPLTRRWLGFEDASLELAEDGTFTARLLVDPPEVNGAPLTSFEGQWFSKNGLIVTAIALTPK